MDAVSSVGGFVTAYHLQDPQTGNGMSISIFDDETAARAAKAAVAERAQAIGWHDTSRLAPVCITDYAVIRISPPSTPIGGR